MHRRFRLPILFAAIAVGTVSLGAAPAAAAPSPEVLVAVGDSITRAFDATSTTAFSDAPRLSWATGTKASVHSLAARLRSQGVELAGVHNDAATGARVADLDGQLSTAASRSATRVTVLIGANDVCTGSISSMTSVKRFRSRFDAALDRFASARPGARIFVSSIPNVYRLWSQLHTEPAARAAWATYRFCPSMLSATNTKADRQRVLDRLRADNRVLAQVCGAHPHCRYDGSAAYHVHFTASQISTVDYFHPNVSGQAVLARAAAASHPWR